MKFAKHLLAKSVPDWKEYYLDYKLLKKQLDPIRKYVEANQSLVDTSLGIVSPPCEGYLECNQSEINFQVELKKQVDKVEYFVYVKLRQCKLQLQQCTQIFFELKYPNQQFLPPHPTSSPNFKLSIQTQNLSQRHSSSSGDVRNHLGTQLHQLSLVLKHLALNFIRLNKLALYKIFKKHDKLVNKLLEFAPVAIDSFHLDMLETIKLVIKSERKFYLQGKQSVLALLEEVQHIQAELNRLGIRQRQDGVL